MEQESRYCHRCGSQTAVSGACPACGGRLVTATQTRRNGWAQLVVGALLAAGVSVVLFNLASNPQPLGPYLLGALGLTVVFGLTTATSGLWQIRSGRRNPRILRLGFGLLVLLALLGWSLRKVLLG